MSTLHEMLTYMRPAGTRMDYVFRKQFLLTLPGAYTDDGGNIHVHVSDDPILWCAHTDTVHRVSGRQQVIRRGNWFELPEKTKSNCLGADDTAGCFVLRQLIRRGVPGHYIFHYGEERGCIGSSWLARKHAKWLATFRMAISVDRRGTGDVITHQLGGRTASDPFAHAVASALGRDWEPTHGVYTDTAEYAEIIPECTNLSAGYYSEHSPRECLCISHVYTLVDTLSSLDLTDFPVKRDPAEIDPESDPYLHYGYDWQSAESYQWERIAKLPKLDKPIGNATSISMRQSIDRDYAGDLTSEDDLYHRAFGECLDTDGCDLATGERVITIRSTGKDRDSFND